MEREKSRTVKCHLDMAKNDKSNSIWKIKIPLVATDQERASRSEVIKN